LATNTIYPSTWLLSADKTFLNLTDNKSTGNEYAAAALSATELRYSFTDKNEVTEERTV